MPSETWGQRTPIVALVVHTLEGELVEYLPPSSEVPSADLDRLHHATKLDTLAFTGFDADGLPCALGVSRAPWLPPPEVDHFDREATYMLPAPDRLTMRATVAPSE